VTADLSVFEGWFEASEWPSARCPVCKVGELGPHKESVKTVTTANSDRHRDDPDWEPEWVFGFFHGVIYCNRYACQEKVIVSGEYRVEMKPHGEYGDYGDFLRLRFAIPALPLVSPPDETPQGILERLEDASRVVWTEPAAAANGLRRCVEALLDHEKISKTRITRQHKRIRLSTHERITAFKERRPDAAISLEAVKWLGNQGSHSSSPLTSSDCVEGAKYLEHALRVLYDTRDVELVKKARAINKAKGIKRSRH
jgi:hypothetical protein